MRRSVSKVVGVAVAVVCACDRPKPQPESPPTAAATPAIPAAPVVAAPAARPPPVKVGGRSFRFPDAVTEPASGRSVEAPMSLTASDGTGLRLVSLDARAVVQEPLAFTELRLAFQNPQDRVIEGHFRITLPQGVTVSRFAMRNDGSWQEGEVVERQAARRAYEDALHRRQDPALLEQGAANEFTARVFPIPAHGVKELIVSYSQELPSQDSGYTLPLRGLPELGRLDVAVAVAGAGPEKLEKAQFIPTADFEVPAA
ncbi:MAG: hypothetical protein HY901_13525, partial [Deltaproteobacteria bacterium]|nr:hypothetical protein [Deltaproteobacteria bacterium]